MLDRLATLVMSTSVLKALPSKLDIKRRSPGILYFDQLVDCAILYKENGTCHMGLDVTKPVFGVSEKARLKPVSSARKLKFTSSKPRYDTKYKKRITKALISLSGCRFSRVEVQYYIE